MWTMLLVFLRCWFVSTVLKNSSSLLIYHLGSGRAVKCAGQSRFSIWAFSDAKASNVTGLWLASCVLLMHRTWWLTCHAKVIIRCWSQLRFHFFMSCWLERQYRNCWNNDNCFLRSELRSKRRTVLTDSFDVIKTRIMLEPLSIPNKLRSFECVMYSFFWMFLTNRWMKILAYRTVKEFLSRFGFQFLLGLLSSFLELGVRLINQFGMLIVSPRSPGGRFIESNKTLDLSQCSCFNHSAMP